MLSEWCTILLRNLSTVLHSSRRGTLLHLLSWPSNASCIHALLRRGAGFLPRCSSSFWPYVWLRFLHSQQFASIELLNLQTDLWKDAPWSWCVGSHGFLVTYLAAMQHLPKSIMSQPSKDTISFSPLLLVDFHWNRFISGQELIEVFFYFFLCVMWFQICMLEQQLVQGFLLAYFLYFNLLSMLFPLCRAHFSPCHCRLRAEMCGCNILTNLSEPSFQIQGCMVGYEEGRQWWFFFFLVGLFFFFYLF